MNANIQADVISAMQLAGVTVAEPDRLRMDGVLCRFSTSSFDRHSKKRNGWATIFTDGERPVVVFGDWSKGLQETILLGGSGAANPAERERQRIAIEQAKAARASEIRARQAAAVQSANSQWNGSRPASEFHPYLMRKRIEPEGLRESGGSLLVPMRDSTGKLHNLQRIRADGEKRFLRGGRVSGLYASIGRMGDHVLVSEGWATGKTLHTHTGLAVAVAFSAGNLVAVAEVIRAKYPAARITICGDNDEKPDGINTGVKAATAAAAAVRGYLAIPPIPGDFNDYAAHCGTPEIIKAVSSERIPN